MATVLDIVNLALSHLADEASVASIDPPEDTTQAQQAARFYPIARDIALTRFPWEFAVKRATLAVPTGVTPPPAWQYVYTVPADCLRMLSVRDPTLNNTLYAKGYPYITEFLSTKVIYTNADNGQAQYIFQQTDTTQFSIEFTDALSYLLASYLAGPITRDRGVGAAMEQLAEVGFAQARIADANGNNPALNSYYVPSAIAARGGTTPQNG